MKKASAFGNYDTLLDLEAQLRNKLELFKLAGNKEELTELIRILSIASKSFQEPNFNGALTSSISKVKKSLDELFNAEKSKIRIAELSTLMGEKERIVVILDALPRFDSNYGLKWGANSKTLIQLSKLFNKITDINKKVISIFSLNIKSDFSGAGDDVMNRIDYLLINVKNENEKISRFYTLIREIISLLAKPEYLQKHVKSIEAKHNTQIHRLFNNWMDELKEQFHICIHDIFPDLKSNLDKQLINLTYKPDLGDRNIIWPVPSKEIHHLIVIPTQNRPSYLDKVLHDLFENAKKYNYPHNYLQVVVVDDSTSSSYEKENHNLVKKFIEQGLPLVYVSKLEQEKLLLLLKGSVGQKIHSYIKNPYSNQKGFGGVRNMLTIIALYYGKEDCIVTYMDDDTTLKNLRYSRGRTSLEFKHCFNYFAHLDTIFSNKQVHLVGGLVTFDLYEGPIVVFHMLRALRTFFLYASGKDPEKTSIKRIRDEILGVTGLQRKMNLSTGLGWLARFCKQAGKFGAYRLPSVVYDEKKPLLDLEKPNNWLGGANISIRYKTIAQGLPYPVVSWRGEDIMWSKMMSKLVGGGIYRANIPIGHIRASSERDVLKEYGQDLGYYAAEQIMQILLPKNSMSKIEIINSLRRAVPESFEITRNIFKRQDNKKDYAYFSTWPNLVEQVRNMIQEEGWWQDHKYKKRIKEVNDFLDLFGSPGIVNSIQEYTPSSEEITRVISQYSDLIENWPKVVASIENLKKKRNH